MDRTAINPWPWSLQMGFSQGERIENFKRILMCAGQTSVDAEGTPQHAGDMAAQITLALDNLEAVLSEAGMGLANLVRLNFYTVDIEAFFAASHVMGERLGAAGVTPPGTLLEIKRLAFPELMIEMEATAAD
jgi:enamine deaminase RidA (YjgF/YER057c/UK114 family)